MKRQSKAGFVRSLPPKTPAKEVVAKAKAKGIKLTEAYVYNVRATTNRKNRENGSEPATIFAHPDVVREVYEQADKKHVLEYLDRKIKALQDARAIIAAD